MSETESENESDLDFSGSEDEYVPSEDGADDSDIESDVSEEEEVIDKPSSSKTITKGEQTARLRTEDDDDSDSSVENYLVNPNEIDLASDFFNPNKAVVPEAPKFDCNVGLSLSDSEEEIFDAVPSTSQAAVAVMDFQAHANFNKNLKDTIEQLKNFKSNNYGLTNIDVTKLLAIGEPSLVAKESSQSKRKEAVNSSDESDFEEVEEAVKTDSKTDVEVRIGPVVKQKPNKLQAEIEASIKRKINRRKKESQLTMHKVHVLSWIAYGNYVNKVLNSTKLMEMVLKYIPSDKCYPKDKTDVDYFQQISKWYKTTVGLKAKEQNCPLKCLPPIATSLALQIQSKMAICKKDFVFIFVILLRSIGIQCRLVVNLATVPIRPAAKDLCVISTKSTEKSESSDKAKTVKKSTKEGKESSQVEKAGKGSQTSKSKLKSQASISGAKSQISSKSSAASNQTKSLKSVAASKGTAKQSIDNPDDDKRKHLKRSVSVQSSSSVNDNNKRSRIQDSSPAKAINVPKVSSSKENGTSKMSLKSRSTSVQEPTSTTEKASKLTLNKQKSAQSTETGAANVGIVESPISHRTRRKPSRSSTISQTIPQLDGGNDKTRGKSKKPKADIFKIKLPVRSRSESPTSQLLGPKTVALSTPPRGRAKSNVPKLRLPSMPRFKSKSPSTTSERASRKSKFENGKSNASSPSSASSASKSVTFVTPRRGSPESNDVSTMSRSMSMSPTSTSGYYITRKSKIENTKSNDSSLLSAESSSTFEVSPMKKNPKLVKSLSELRSPKTSNAAKRTISPSPSKNESNPDEKLTSETETQKNVQKLRAKPAQSKSSDRSTSEILSPLKQADKKLTPATKDSKTTSKGATVPRTRSNRSDSKTEPSTAVSSKNSSEPPSKSASTSASKQKPKPESASSSAEKPSKKTLKRRPTKSVSSDSDFAPTPKKKLSPAVDKPLPKQVERLKKRIDRRILSTDDESVEPAVKKDDMNYWVEVYCEAEGKWMCIDLFKLKVDCNEEVKKKATKPIAYVFAWNNNNKIKDVSPRYCSQWNTTTRKLRVQPDWLDEAMSRYREPLSQRCVAEDRELEEIHAQTPIPTSISEFKNHPLYVLTRHLLKFEGIYPPNSVPLGHIRGEPIYSRFCVHTLHSREIWVKQARVVKPGEEPYKIVKARPKWDRLANKMLEPLPLEIFGRWQTGPYVPPTAENGIVPRNAYGNVELFKPEMLPKKTVHLQLAGLNRVCAKLKIDCAQAVVGFDFHGGSSHPTFDGFVVCEEFAELVTERWCEEQEESHRKAQEKRNQRVYDNWKKLIKGLLIRERLQRKYNFAGKGAPKEK